MPLEPRRSGRQNAAAAADNALCGIDGQNGRGFPDASLRGALCGFDVPSPGTSERELGRLASRQHGCLHRRQLRAAGIGAKGIRGRIVRGQLSPLLSDLFLLGRHEDTAFTRAMAVALHLRGDGVISHESAAWLWGFSDKCPETVHALLLGRSTSSPPGTAVHRVGVLDACDVRWRRGIPATSPARSFLDFAGRVSLPRAESGLAMLRRETLRIDAQIRDALTRLPANHPGAPVARRLLAMTPGELAVTRSRYERILRRLLKEAGLPTPLSNLMVAGAERDLVWPQAKLILEFDGWEFHRHRFEADRRRDAAAVAAGWRVIRLTADRVDSEPFAVIAEIAAALAHAHQAA